MTQKERLVELLKACPDNHVFMFDGDFDLFESLADYVLDNGVIVPPCKVGDTVYMIDYDCEYQFVVDCDASCGSCKHRIDEIRKCLVRNNHQAITVMESWGNDYFPTCEAAERALKECETK